MLDVDDEKAEQIINEQLDKYGEQGKEMIPLLDVVYDTGIPYDQAERIMTKLLGPPAYS